MEPEARPQMIDLRSDTVTKPTPGMRAAMAAAVVGDDVYGEDPTVNAFESRVAKLFGHEAGLYCPTGSMTNLLGVQLLVQPGQEVLCDDAAHIARAEMGAHASISGVTMRTFRSDFGLAEPDAVAELLSPNAGPYLVSTAAVALENTHNFGGGTVQPYENLTAVSAVCVEHGVGRHLDGARIWNAAVATGVPLADYGRLFDTVSVCFSKGLGAPVGSMVLSSAERIVRARVLRKRLGGGWRQAGILAAAAEYALDQHLPRLSEDHRAARALAEAVAERTPAAVHLDRVHTNIVVLHTGDQPGSAVAAAAAEQQILVSALGPHLVRAVTHQEISVADAEAAGRALGKILAP